MQILLALLLVIVSMVFIMFNCDAFEPAADFLGKEVYKMPPGVRGASIEAVASSLPEFFTTMFLLFLFHDEDGFAAGVATCAGSAIFNAAVIPGICILAVTFKGVQVEGSEETVAVDMVQLRRATLIRDGSVFLAAEIVLIIFLSFDKMKWWMGACLMLMYIIYVVVLLSGVGMGENDAEAGVSSGATDNPLRAADTDEEQGPDTESSAASASKPEETDEATDGDTGDIDGASGDDEEDNGEDDSPNMAVALVTCDWHNVFFGGKAFTAASAWTVVSISTLWLAGACYLLAEAVIISAEALDVAPYFTAVILGAAASSVPDTIISYKDAMKGDYDDAIANAIGSNIFDICFALGLPLFLYGLIVDEVDMTGAGEGDKDVSEIQSLRILLIGCSVVILALFLITATSKDDEGRALHHVGMGQAVGLLTIYVLWTGTIILQAADVFNFASVW